jgi:CheY-like chemotaxis protein
MDDRTLREVIHDLNNELAVISASVELAAAGPGHGADVQEQLDRIRTATRAATELVRTLRGDATGAGGEGRPLDDSPAREPGRKVLVVDDSQTMRQLIAYALEAVGFEVSLAADAAEALARIDATEEPDLLLADVHMPVMSGPELAACARRLRPELPIVFVTGDADEVIDFEGGTGPAVRKPFVASELVQAVRAALDR